VNDSPQRRTANDPTKLAELALSLGLDPDSGRQVVCVMGLGFAGSAMAAAVAAARDTAGVPYFDVVGVDLPSEVGAKRITAVREGRPPVQTTDEKFAGALREGRERRNLVATDDERAYELSAVTVVDIPLDVAIDGGRASVPLEEFLSAIRTLGRRMPAGSLVIVETTVPPGTCVQVIRPELDRELTARGLEPGSILLAHSYERVMPGDTYLDSIVNYWRSYAGDTVAAADACEAFLSRVVNVADYPLTRLASTTACEIGKVLENSYRATTIALMEEWGRFAEAVGVDLFEVVRSIRVRPTHSNMRQPGFGVGGYCLTKDPLLAEIAAREFYDRPDLRFPFSTGAVEVNRRMPLVSVEMLASLLGGSLRSRRVLLLGVSYRQDVGDTRYSPSETFVRAARDRGAKVVCHDPLVDVWPELGEPVRNELPDAGDFDALVFAVPHQAYIQLDLEDWLGNARPVVLDANAVLSSEQRSRLLALGCPVQSVGRGIDL
jgi:nucleotide sugar dehydrogenase